MTAKADWKRHEAGFYVDVSSFNFSAADVSSEGRVRLDLGNSSTGPVMDLAASFKGKNAENTAKYLPAKVMNKDAVNWISRSIKAGTVSEGAAVFKGPVQKFPYHNKEGVFKNFL